MLEATTSGDYPETAILIFCKRFPPQHLEIEYEKYYLCTPQNTHGGCSSVG
jgi:hypothetical protein